VTTQAIAHSAHLDWQQTFHALFTTAAAQSSAATNQIEKYATVFGMNDAAAVVVVLLGLGATAVTVPAIVAVRREQRLAQQR